MDITFGNPLPVLMSQSFDQMLILLPIPPQWAPRRRIAGKRGPASLAAAPTFVPAMRDQAFPPSFGAQMIYPFKQ